MQCPACKNEMLIIENERIELDYCAACGGVWLDAGELALLLEGREKAVNRLLEAGRAAAAAERARTCPICLAKMGKMVYGTGKPVVLDCCRFGHGLWFDRGELDAILAMAAPDGQEAAMVDFLKGTFVDPASRAETPRPG